MLFADYKRIIDESFETNAHLFQTGEKNYAENNSIQTPNSR